MQLQSILYLCLFQWTKSPGCSPWSIRSSSPGSSRWKECYQLFIFFKCLNESLTIMQHITPLCNAGSYMPSSGHIGRPAVISKGDSWCLPKGVDLRLRSTNERASGHERLKAPESFVSWEFFCFVLFCLFIFLAVLGLHCCVRAFSSCGQRGLLFIAVCGLLTAVASLLTEHGL